MANRFEISALCNEYRQTKDKDTLLILADLLDEDTRHKEADELRLLIGKIGVPDKGGDNELEALIYVAKLMDSKALKWVEKLTKSIRYESGIVDFIKNIQKGSVFVGQNREQNICFVHHEKIVKAINFITGAKMKDDPFFSCAC